jgi:glycosyltransferase involved in cell wall biosynthesis
MNVYVDNVNLTSPSGPNSFARNLCRELGRLGHTVHTSPPAQGVDAQLTFIQTNNMLSTAKKHVLRLDGIYFNSKADWRSQNSLIEKTYNECDTVVCQTEFNKRLTEAYFGSHRDVRVINNGTDLETIRAIQPHEALRHLDKKIWCCSSHWRPHKRLLDDISYFHEFAPDDHYMIVLGKTSDDVVSFVKSSPDGKRVAFAGDLSWKECISIYKSCDTFVHLAYLDHCPNVVVDARASGCKIVVSSTGGTKEVAGRGAILIEEDEWDFRPIDLYSPPKMDFSRRSVNVIDSSVDVIVAASKYVDAMTS